MSEEPTVTIQTEDPVLVREQQALDEQARERARRPASRAELDATDRRVNQHEKRLVNMATVQEVGILKGRMHSLVVWYLIGIFLLVAMLAAVILLQHYWR